ncbi:MAG: DUF4222 domain-containing protein [Hafnia sp.]
MKIKNSGFTASGHAQPKKGDKYKDSHGSLIEITYVFGERVTYKRDGYNAECVCSIGRLRRDFLPIEKLTIAEWNKKNKTSEKIDFLYLLIEENKAGKK